MWKFALVLAVVHGAACIAPSTYWVLETLKCSKHRVILAPNRNLVETPEALDQMCKRQDAFYHCLEKLVSLMEPASVSELLSETAGERSVFNSLCSKDSPWRRRYLECAPCINMQQTDFCSTPEFLSADGTDLNSPDAHVEEKIENCIAATLSIKCGVEAGLLFHYLLKLKGDDVCQPVEMTNTDANPSSNGNHSTECVFDEIYDQLVKKIGYIPEQDSEESFVLHKRVGHMHEESESVDENISSSLEIEDSDPYSHFMEQDYSENMEHAVSEDNGSVSEVTTSTVDETSDEDLPEMSDIFKYFGLKIQDIIKTREESKARGAHTLPSIIKDRIRIVHTFKPENYETLRFYHDGLEDGFEKVEHDVFEENDSVTEATTSTVDQSSDEDLYEPGMFAIFKYYGLRMQDIIKLQDELRKRAARTLPSIKDSFRSPRTLNPEKNYETVRVFSDGRINYYSRRRDIQDLETIKCYNFPDYFVCINMPRLENPQCLKTTVFTGPREGKFFPEELDPEFGAQWYETTPNEAYLFEPWFHQTIEDESDQQSYTSASVTENTQASYVPVNRGSDDGVEILEDVDADTHIVSKDSLPFNTKDSDAYEFTTKENKAETIMHLFKVFTAALPSTSKIEIKDSVPENVAEALENLHKSNGEFFENVKIRLDKSGNVYIFWNNLQESVIDTITCGKVNECHPKGEGIWKCVIVPRPPIETDSLDI